MGGHLFLIRYTVVGVKCANSLQTPWRWQCCSAQTLHFYCIGRFRKEKRTLKTGGDFFLSSFFFFPLLILNIRFLNLIILFIIRGNTQMSFCIFHCKRPVFWKMQGTYSLHVVQGKQPAPPRSGRCFHLLLRDLNCSCSVSQGSHRSYIQWMLYLDRKSVV